MSAPDLTHKFPLEFDPVVPTEILIILLLVGAIIFIWDLLDRRRASIMQQSGFDRKSEVVALRGSSRLPDREYVSDSLGLSSKPPGLIRDGEFLIPVEYAPLSKKVQDRHVIQLVAHMVLVEEIEGKRPPYGLLVLGPDARSVKIKYSEEKVAWLNKLLAEMRAILDGREAVPSPAYYKCKSCDVNEICSHSLFKPGNKPSNSGDHR